MINIKKQLTGIKISRFLKINKLVIFFHYNSKTIDKWYATKAKISLSLALRGKNSYTDSNEKKHKRYEQTIGATLLSLAEKSRFSSEQLTVIEQTEGITKQPPMFASQTNSLIIKNKIAFKVISSHSVKFNQDIINIAPLSVVKGTVDGCLTTFGTAQKGFNYDGFHKQINVNRLTKFSSKEAKNALCTKPLCFSGKDKKIDNLSNSVVNKQKKNLLINEKRLAALFQGPTTLLGLNNIKILDDVLTEYNQDKNLIILGGIYNGEILLNQQDLQKMAQLSKKDCNLVSIFKEIQKPALYSLFILKKGLSFDLLKVPQYNLLSTLFFRSRQLSQNFLSHEEKISID